MTCLCAATRRASRAITRVYEAEFRTIGLQASQFWLLMELSQRGRISQVDLLKNIALDQTTLSRNIAVLVRNKWVKSQSVSRQRFYTVTPAGKAMLDQAKPLWMKAQKRMQQALGADWELVLQGLERLTAAAAIQENE